MLEHRANFRSPQGAAHTYKHTRVRSPVSLPHIMHKRIHAILRAICLPNVHAAPGWRWLRAGKSSIATCRTTSGWAVITVVGCANQAHASGGWGCVGSTLCTRRPLRPRAA